MDNNKQIWTVGHSNHEIEYFIELLEPQNIKLVIDVRSTPASNYNPQFNKDNLNSSLDKKHIHYRHFGEEFGARQTDDNILDDDGVVDFIKFRKSYQFQQGIEKLDLALDKEIKIAIMCAEGDPLECHRLSMISVYLKEIGINVIHIIKDRTTKTQDDIEDELLKKYAKKLPKPDLFNPEVNQDTQLEVAYKLHNKEIGWQSNNDQYKDIYQ